ncbi:MAG: hypothetical protein LBE34_11525 [Flavobacteriaceae bacterium]|jgi:hypothetical protein|nr:hypothetical protein [Flavobacteriaceae bacterium]
MRKLLGIFAIALGFIACENDVKVNDPGMHSITTVDVITDTLLLKQIKVNPSLQYNRFTEFKPQEYKALVANNRSLIIEAKTDSTKLMIFLPEYEYGARYDFNANDGIKASYFIYDENDKEIGVYNTETTEAVKERPGYVLIDTEAKQVPNTISGTFVINMGGKLVPQDVMDPQTNKMTKKYVNRKSFEKGIFFRIPLAPAK